MRDLLRRPLNAARAVQVALLNNRALQATFAEVGVSYGEYVSAGLLKNPTLTASARFPDRSSYLTDWEGAVAQDFLNAILLPLRKRLAAEGLRAVELHVADETLRTAAEDRAGVLHLPGAPATHRPPATRRRHERRPPPSSPAACTRRATSTTWTSSTSRPAFSQAKIDVTQARAQTLSDRETVNRLLGLDGAQAGAWTAEKSLPPIPGRDPSAATLEARATVQRLDLQAARAEVAAAERALALRVGTRYLPAGVSVGVDSEREPEGEHITGPTLDLELPIFNQGQGEIATLRARDLQARRQLEAKTVDAHAEVRAARAQVAANRELALSIRDTVLPQRREALKLTLQQYNSMLKGAYDLLTAKANEAAAERVRTSRRGAIIGSRGRIWERAIGGKLR